MYPNKYSLAALFDCCEVKMSTKLCFILYCYRDSVKNCAFLFEFVVLSDGFDASPSKVGKCVHFHRKRWNSFSAAGEDSSGSAALNTAQIVTRADVSRADVSRADVSRAAEQAAVVRHHATCEPSVRPSTSSSVHPRRPSIRHR